MFVLPALYLRFGAGWTADRLDLEWRPRHDCGALHFEGLRKGGTSHGPLHRIDGRVFTACLAAPCASALAAETAVKKIMPALVEATNDAKIMKVTLTPKAAERLGIVIDEVRVDPSGRRIVPYASVLYDLTVRRGSILPPIR